MSNPCLMASGIDSLCPAILKATVWVISFLYASLAQLVRAIGS